MQNPESRIQQSFSRGLGAATTKVDHQIYDLLGILNAVIHPPALQNTQLNSDASAEVSGSAPDS